VKALVVTVLLSGCIASTNSVFVTQTKSAKGWFCKDEPVVDCRGGCSSESKAWRAYCGNKRYACKFNEERGGERMRSSRDEPVFRSVFCQPDS
jgi:hypothetical protein